MSAIEGATGAAPPDRTCLLCRTALTHAFLDFGTMPLANSYLEPEQLDCAQPQYPLRAHLCSRCFLVQVEPVVPPEDIFSDYAYFSSFSASWLDHARTFAKDCQQRLGLHSGSLVVEVGSNDGYLLKHFLAAGIPVLGVEPAQNVARAARDAGVPTEVRFFGAHTANDLSRRGVAADLIVALNVFAHVPDLPDFSRGLSICLKPTGVVAVEFPHLLQLIDGVQFDTIYHEHLCYFSLRTAEQALETGGLTVFDVEELPTHGGSLRVWAGHAGVTRVESERLLALRRRERDAGLGDIATYSRFADRVRRCQDSIRAFLSNSRGDGNTVVAYGAAAKGNTLLNSCHVTSEDIAFVADRSPHKQGKFLPGSRLPIKPPEAVFTAQPNFLLILPWNLKDEIMAQMADIRRWGGRFVTPVPEVRIHS